MRGERYLKKNSQFSLVYDEGKTWAGKEIVLKSLSNGTNSSRFGFVVSHRVGKAVVRNKIKRRLREIARQIKIQPGWDIILIARLPAAEADYATLEKTVGKLILRAGLIVKENENNSLIAN
ncbi:MAG: ribonuclease P protein component [Dehalococcoidales bacterium]